VLVHAPRQRRTQIQAAGLGGIAALVLAGAVLAAALSPF